MISSNNYKEQSACMNCKFHVTKKGSSHCYCNLDDTFKTYLNLDLYEDYDIEEIFKWEDDHDVSCAGICDEYKLAS